MIASEMPQLPLKSEHCGQRVCYITQNILQLIKQPINNRNDRQMTNKQPKRLKRCGLKMLVTSVGTYYEFE